MAPLPRALSPLRHPAYRRLAASLTFSLLGGGLWVVAVVWQVVALGGGPAQLSLVTGTAAGAMLVTALLGGVLADRVPQKRILLAVELVRGGAVAVVAVLSLSGALTVTHLVVVALVSGLTDGLYYPAYSALLPRLVDPDDLLAANGLEGMLRPVLAQAAGPAAAGVLVAALSPGAALAATAAAAVAAAGCVTLLPRPADPPDESPAAAEPGHPVAAVLRDLREGFRYMVSTRWFLATLLFAAAMILFVLGPLEVLTPFAIKERAGGGPGEHALVLAATGIGGAVGSMVVASLRLPRRYLTVMIMGWGLACVPMAVFGLATSLWPMVAAGFVVGALFNAPQVIWGTLLQRRVPAALLGRVSSLDFFVSLALMPLSMALAGPVGVWLGLTATFLVAGLVPVGLAVLTVVLGRLAADELAHPLEESPDEPVARVTS